MDSFRRLSSLTPIWRAGEKELHIHSRSSLTHFSSLVLVSSFRVAKFQSEEKGAGKSFKNLLRKNVKNLLKQRTNL